MVAEKTYCSVFLPQSLFLGIPSQINRFFLPFLMWLPCKRFKQLKMAAEKDYIALIQLKYNMRRPKRVPDKKNVVFRPPFFGILRVTASVALQVTVPDCHAEILKNARHESAIFVLLNQKQQGPQSEVHRRSRTPICLVTAP